MKDKVHIFTSIFFSLDDPNNHPLVIQSHERGPSGSTHMNDSTEYVREQSTRPMPSTYSTTSV